MKVWLVDRDDNDCDNRSNLVVTEAVCDSGTRAAQFIFDETGAWPEKAEDGALSLRDRNGHDWSAYEYEVLASGHAAVRPNGIYSVDAGDRGRVFDGDGLEVTKIIYVDTRDGYAIRLKHKPNGELDVDHDAGIFRREEVWIKQPVTYVPEGSQPPPFKAMADGLESELRAQCAALTDAKGFIG
jgi:hypothetical protein